MFKKKFSLMLMGLISTSVFASNPPVHTWHTVSSTNNTWQATLQMLNQGGSFVDRDGAPLNNFVVSPDHSQDFGFSFDKGDNFDVAYTLTMVEKADTRNPTFASKTCVFVITAAGPANPDIRVETYNGAKCNYKVVSGKGEDYTVG